jgi:hypothetical protein
MHKTTLQAPPLLVFSPTSDVCTKQHYKHRPCWCFHQQAFEWKIMIGSTALVGVFTNKRRMHKTTF